MFRIPPHKKTRNLPDYMQEHLQPIHPEDTRKMVSMFCFLLLDGSLIFLLVPYNETIAYSLIPFIGCINLWAIRLIIKNPFKTQLETLLFMICNFVMTAITYFILTVRLAYVYAEITNMWVYITFSIGIIFCILKLLRYQVIKYSKLDYKLKEHEKWYNSGTVTFGAVLIWQGGTFFLAVTSFQRLASIFELGVLLILMVVSFCYFSVKYIHKYCFIKHNIDYFNYSVPSDKSKRVRYKKQGFQHK
ncbi:hypothetical protein [Pseudalkalibacillus hwajinpoensis]|uniref:hypothetical protein n=1 Tax=Guptibacillus hwajinpoensis TaxID=208199 RepID=UPI001CD6135F|nr:hypothetical protein [Pseudalkalibacillus hwajinpoensis]MCA0993826.1 hypothetical protein [Pseudalkalibacillus hwajinpoensis]